MSTKRHPAIGFIFFTLLIDVIGFGIVIPVMPNLIKTLGHTDNSHASQISGWLISTYAAVQFLFSPVLGNLSDKYGRRPILLFSLFGFGIDYLFLSFAPSIAWFFVGRIIAGITGASFTTASAYIADISTKENRAQNFGMVGAAFGLGFIIGPALGGVLGHWGLRVPFYAAAALSLLNWLYGYFVLPESLPKENRRPFNWSSIVPLANLKILWRYDTVKGLVASLALVYIAVHAVQSNWTFFNVEKFKWTPITIGISLAVVGALVGGVQAGLTRVLNPKIGDEKSIYIGLFLYAVGLGLFAFASQSWMMFVFLIPYCLGGISGPSLQSVLSSEVPSNEQGELQGALTSLMSLTSVFGPFIMTNLFGYFIGPKAPFYFAGASFLLGAVLMLISAALAYRTLHWKPKRAGEELLRSFPEQQ